MKYYWNFFVNSRLILLQWAEPLYFPVTLHDHDILFHYPLHLTIYCISSIYYLTEIFCDLLRTWQDDFFAAIILFKNCFDKFINYIFFTVKNNWFAKFIINANSFINKIARNMILIFFSIWSAFFSIINMNFKFSKLDSVSPYVLNGTTNYLKWFLNLIVSLLNFTVYDFTFYHLFSNKLFIFLQDFFTTKTL